MPACSSKSWKVDWVFFTSPGPVLFVFLYQVPLFECLFICLTGNLFCVEWSVTIYFYRFTLLTTSSLAVYVLVSSYFFPTSSWILQTFFSIFFMTSCGVSVFSLWSPNLTREYWFLHGFCVAIITFYPSSLMMFGPFF